MNRPRWEVADVIRRYGDDFLAAHGDSTSAAQRHVLEDLAACRTPALGGHVDQCDACGHLAILHNSCRNRHCPTCRASASADWLDDRKADLLPVPYFHAVFTLPGDLAPLALQNKKVVYDILFEATAKTLLQIAADPKHLGAQIGFLAILHTWGQSLLHHPHVHCVIPGGGLSLDRSQWTACSETFFLPVRVLSQVFRGKFLDLLRGAFARHDLSFHGQLAHLADADRFDAHLKRSCKKAWVVYCKPPFGGPEQVLKYLARYTHRIAISNDRLVSIDDGKVKFRWKDYADENSQRTMTLAAPEFIRRFLLHVLPKGFVRIRHYGLLANGVRRARLELCRDLLPASPMPAAPPAPVDPSPPVDTDDAPLCPACHRGRMRFLRRLKAFETFDVGQTHPTIDSS